jgi:hypothetical protein
VYLSVSVVLAATLMLLGAACVPDPHAMQMADLLDQLNSARSMLTEQPPRVDDACTVVGNVQSRLYGEPGLVDVRPAWPLLRDAADALHAACGQGTLLAQPSTDSPALQTARQRWTKGIQREIGIACDHLRAAADALGRGAPC